MEGRREEAVGHTVWDLGLTCRTSSRLPQIANPCISWNQQHRTNRFEVLDSESPSPRDMPRAPLKSGSDADQPKSDDPETEHEAQRK